jgi:hypothetical protein
MQAPWWTHAPFASLRFAGRTNGSVPTQTKSTECWEFYQIVFWDRFQMASGSAPGPDPAYDYERVESFISQ